MLLLRARRGASDIFQSQGGAQPRTGAASEEEAGWRSLEAVRIRKAIVWFRFRTDCCRYVHPCVCKARSRVVDVFQRELRRSERCYHY